MSGEQQTDLFTGEASDPVPESVRSRIAQNHTLAITMEEKAARGVLRSDRVKNMFEVPNTVKWSGDEYGKDRRNAELRLFGIPKDAPGHERPVYGWLRKLDEIPKDADNYGNVTMDVKLPPEAKVTTTDRDSFRTDTSVEDLHSGHKADDTDDYREIQFHDRPVPSENVTHIHVMPKVFQNLSRADSYGNEEDREQREKEQAGIVAAHKETVKGLREAGYTGPISTWVMRHFYQPTLDEAAEGADIPGHPQAERAKENRGVKHSWYEDTTGNEAPIMRPPTEVRPWYE